MARSLAIIALAASAYAQSTPTGTFTTSAAEASVTLFAPIIDQQPLVASVINADDEATTFGVACRSPGNQCGLSTSTYTITQGPSTWAMTYSVAANAKLGTGAYANEMACEMDWEASSAMCDVHVSQQVDGVDFDSSTSAKARIGNLVTAAVTANVNLLSIPPATATITTALGPNGTPSTDSDDSITEGDSDDGEGAAPRIGGSVILAGAAAAIGAVLLL